VTHFEGVEVTSTSDSRTDSGVMLLDQ
jgi:hypothetical protein